MSPIGVLQVQKLGDYWPTVHCSALQDVDLQANIFCVEQVAWRFRYAANYIFVVVIRDVLRQNWT